jgi:hypothetical protein
MEVKKVLISLVCLMMLSAFTVMGQVAVKTNLAMDALAIPNVGLEVGISKKLSLDVPVYYNPWKQVMWKEQDNKLFKLFMVQPEIRYWLCDKFNGHFFGVHAMGGAYNTTGIELPLTPFDDLGDNRYKGHFYGGGISYGYQYILSRHWSIEGTIGIGYAYVRYKKYPCEACAGMTDKGTENYFGPTRAALNLIYVF